MKELISGILVKLLKYAVAPNGANEHLRGQSKRGVKTVDAHPIEMQFGCQVFQVDTGDWRKKVGAQPNDLKGSLIDPGK